MKSTLEWARRLMGDLEKKKRFTQEEALDIIIEINLMRLSMDVLEKKARKDLDYHLNKPTLKLVE